MILLVEDHPEMKRLLAGDLRAAGHALIELSCGEDAKTWLRASRQGDPLLPIPDLVISDVNLPDGSGLDLLDSLRQLEAPPPMILITAFPSDSLLRTALARGAACVLAKPFPLEDLHAAVADVLREKDPAVLD